VGGTHPAVGVEAAGEGEEFEVEVMDLDGDPAVEALGEDRRELG
jgi:hypothetical protein